RSILASACVILGLALSGTFVRLVTMSVIARLAMYAATCAALPILRRKHNVLAPTFKLRGGFVIAVVSALLCIWMLLNSTGQEALMTAIAVGVGLVLYLANRMTKTDDDSGGDRRSVPDDKRNAGHKHRIPKARVDVAGRSNCRQSDQRLQTAKD